MKKRKSLVGLCTEFVRNVRAQVREQVREEILFAIQHPSQAKMRAEARGRPRYRKSGALKIAKRSAFDLNQHCEVLATAILGHPGKGIETLAKIIGTETRQLFLPIRKLLAQGRIRKIGHKRATRYYPTSD